MYMYQTHKAGIISVLNIVNGIPGAFTGFTFAQPKMCILEPRFPNQESITPVLPGNQPVTLRHIY